MSKRKENNVSLFTSLLYLKNEFKSSGFIKTACTLNETCSVFMQELIEKKELGENFATNEEMLDILEQMAPDVLDQLIENVDVGDEDNVVDLGVIKKNVH